MGVDSYRMAVPLGPCHSESPCWRHEADKSCRDIADVNAWWQHHRPDPTSTTAQAALQTMRVHHRTQVKSFYRNHHVTVTSSRMRFGAGGWMGLRGMWGGWGW